MTAWIGVFTLALAFCAAVATTVAGFAGAWRERASQVARWGAAGCLVAAAGSVAALEWALLRHDFSVRFVAENGSLATPPYYTVTSLWAAHDGSLLLWNLVVAAYLAVLTLRPPAASAVALHRWAVGVVGAVAAFFLGLALFTTQVFDRVSPAPADGPGPTPLLQDHPAMGIHPPLLYIGLAGLVVPFGYAVAGLVTGQVSRAWIAAVAVPLRVSWTALTAGIVLGAWWSYAVLGWGGYWSWDPVENSSLMPWLVATALLHSLMVQRRRGALPLWNLSLAVGAFLLAGLGVLLTRSGILTSVHSFADSGVGAVLLGFLVAVGLAVAALAYARAGRSTPAPAAGRWWSRGTALLLNNLVLVVLTVTVLLGTLLPVLAEATTGDEFSVGPPYYDRMAVPLVLLLLVLMAVGPELTWRGGDPGRVVRALALPVVLGAVTVLFVQLLAPGPPYAAAVFGLAVVVLARTVLRTVAERGWRRRSVLGGRVAHVGLAVLAIGVAASSAYTQSVERRLEVGEAATVGGVSATLLSVQGERAPRYMRTSATVRVAGETTRPELRFYTARQQTVAGPAILSDPGRDVYLTVMSVDREAGRATLRLAVNPLVGWVWAGGGIMVVGGLLGIRRPRRRPRGPRRPRSLRRSRRVGTQTTAAEPRVPETVP